MKIVKCKETWIKFKPTHIQGQRIRFSEHTSATHLEVTFQDEYVSLAFISKDNQILKLITFNRTEIVEVETSEVFETMSS